MIGGVSKINKINYYKKNIRVNDEKIIVPITRPNNFGAINFDGGELIDYLSRGLLPTSSRLIGKGEFSFASAALKYSFNLQPGESKEVFVVVPFHPDFVGKPDIQFNLSQEQASNLFNKKLEETISFGESKLNQVQFSLPLQPIR